MPPDHPIQRGKLYNRLITAVIGLGVVAFFVGMALDRYVAGLVVYAAAGLSAVAALLYLRFASSVRLGDERDRRLRDRTSGTVLALLTYVGLPTVIGLYLLDATDDYVIGPTLWGAIFAYAGLYLLWGVVYTIYRYRG